MRSYARGSSRLAPLPAALASPVKVISDGLRRDIRQGRLMTQRVRSLLRRGRDILMSRCPVRAADALPVEVRHGNFGIAGLWLFLALALIVSILVGAASVWLAHRVIHEPVPTGHNAALSPFLTCVGLVYGALLGFTIVVAWEQFSSAEANVANEASTLTTMYRQTVGMPVPEQTQMRDLVRKYATAVEGPEWRQQDVAGTTHADAGTTHTARAALTDMYRVLGGAQSSVAASPISQEFLGQLTVLASDRNQRILDVRPSNTGVAVDRSALRRCRGRGARWFHAPGQHTWSPSPIERGRRPARSAAVHHLLARPSLQEPLGVTSAPFQHCLNVFDASTVRHHHACPWRAGVSIHRRPVHPSSVHPSFSRAACRAGVLGMACAQGAVNAVRASRRVGPGRRPSRPRFRGACGGG